MTEKIEIIVSGDAKNLTAALKQAGVSVKEFSKETAQAGQAGKGFGLSVGQMVTAVAGVSLVQGAAGMLKDFAIASHEAARAQNDAKNALTGLLGSAQAYQQAMGQIRTATNGTISETDAARAAFGLLDNGIAKSATEAAQYVQAGKALNAALGETASFEKFLMLLDEGSDMLLNNFNITGSMIEARQQEIMVTEGLSEKEARLAAVRQLAMEKGLALAGSISDETQAAQQASAAFADFTASFGQLILTLDNATGATAAFTGVMQLMTQGAQSWQYVFKEAIPTINAHNQAMDEAAGLNLATAQSYEQLAAALGGGIVNLEAVRQSLVENTGSYDDYNAKLDELAQLSAENLGGFESTIFTLGMTREEYDSLTASIQQHNAVEAAAVQLAQAQASARAAESANLSAAAAAAQQAAAQQAAINAEAERWAGIAQVNNETMAVYSVTTADVTMGLVAYEQAQKEAIAAEEGRQQTLMGLASSTADYYTGLAELQAGGAEGQASLNAQIADLQAQGVEAQTASAQALTDDLTQIEQERADKIHWVLTGAHARTQEGNDAALGYWIAHYDQLVTAATEKSQTQTAVELAELDKRKTAIASAHAQERAEYEAHLNELKLRTALGLLETTGQLEQLTGLVGLGAAQAAELINAGVLPVTQEFGAAIQTAMSELSAGQDEAAATATTNQATLKAAFDGTLPAIQSQANALKTELPQAASAGTAAIGGFAASTRTQMNEVRQAVLSGTEAFTKEDWPGIGKSIIQGVDQGIEKNQDKVLERLKRLAREAVSAAEQELGIHSPSTVFTEIGTNITQGLAGGISMGSSQVADQMGGLLHFSGQLAAGGMARGQRRDLSNLFEAALRNQMPTIAGQGGLGAGDIRSQVWQNVQGISPNGQVAGGSMLRIEELVDFNQISQQFGDAFGQVAENIRLQNLGTAMGSAGKLGGVAGFAAQRVTGQLEAQQAGIDAERERLKLLQQTNISMDEQWAIKDQLTALDQQQLDLQAQQTAAAEKQAAIQKQQQDLQFMQQQLGLIQMIKDSGLSVQETLGNIQFGLGASAGDLATATSNVMQAMLNQMSADFGILQAGPGFASGGSFVVPPGYPNDSFPMHVSSGESVSVSRGGSGGGLVIQQLILNGVQDVQGLYRALQHRAVQF